ncbi:hypothetical protein H2202_000190 [Exophiala xenobiotica]|nr:hypothetical protein H2202_000190 [Exophiala xenobiotica]
MSSYSKTGASFDDAASISTSTTSSSFMNDKEKAQADAHANKKPSLLKRAVTVADPFVNSNQEHRASGAKNPAWTT